MRLSWLEAEAAYPQPLLTSKVGQKFLVCDQGTLVGLCTQDYKFLCAARKICATMINIKTHTPLKCISQ